MRMVDSRPRNGPASHSRYTLQLRCRHNIIDVLLLLMIFGVPITAHSSNSIFPFNHVKAASLLIVDAIDRSESLPRRKPGYLGETAVALTVEQSAEVFVAGFGRKTFGAEAIGGVVIFEVRKCDARGCKIWGERLRRRQGTARGCR